MRTILEDCTNKKQNCSDMGFRKPNSISSGKKVESAIVPQNPKINNTIGCIRRSKIIKKSGYTKKRENSFAFTLKLYNNAGFGVGRNKYSRNNDNNDKKFSIQKIEFCNNKNYQKYEKGVLIRIDSLRNIR